MGRQSNVARGLPGRQGAGSMIPKSPESHDALAFLSSHGLYRNVRAHAGRGATVQRQLSGVPSEVGVGRWHLYFVPVQYVGRLQGGCCGLFRHVLAEPLCAAAVSAGPQTASPIGAIAAAARSKRARRRLYSITSSARASKAGGTTRSIAFAVRALTISSTLVGPCTGRSAGFSPFRIRSI